ncbi:MAG: ubiquitin [Oscillospiraceae bacterium]|nr:ubiquitin [Oscillospiraceae bacterium]
MTDFEKAEKLCEKANVSFAEAKEALENSDGNILDAMIYLEGQGKAATPEGGGFFSGAETSSKNENSSENYNNYGYRNDNSGESFSDMMNRFGNFCTRLFHKGLNNHLEASKDGRYLFSLPVLVLVLLLCISFWITPFIFVNTLFCGVRYRFTGDDLGKESVNSVMDNATEVVEDVKSSFTDNKK